MPENNLSPIVLHVRQQESMAACADSCLENLPRTILLCAGAVTFLLGSAYAI